MIAATDLSRAPRATWAAGDYAAVAEPIDDAPPRDLLARTDLAPDQDVLDVAAGTGDAAIPAALAGARGGRDRPHSRAFRDSPPARGPARRRDRLDRGRRRAALRGRVVRPGAVRVRRPVWARHEIVAGSFVRAQAPAAASSSATRIGPRPHPVPLQLCRALRRIHGDPLRLALKAPARLTANGPLEDCHAEIALAEPRKEATDGSPLMRNTS